MRTSLAGISLWAASLDLVTVGQVLGTAEHVGLVLNDHRSMPGFAPAAELSCVASEVIRLRVSPAA